MNILAGGRIVDNQELHLGHISLGMWLVGIDLHIGNEITKNPLGILHVTGEENLYHMSEEGRNNMSEKNKDMEFLASVDAVAKELGVPLDKLISAVKKLGNLRPNVKGEKEEDQR